MSSISGSKLSRQHYRGPQVRPALRGDRSVCKSGPRSCYTAAKTLGRHEDNPRRFEAYKDVRR